MKKLLLFVFVLLSIEAFPQFNLDRTWNQIMNDAIEQRKEFRTQYQYGFPCCITVYENKYEYCSYMVDNLICYREMYIVIDSTTNYIKSMKFVEKTPNESITYSTYNSITGEIEITAYIDCIPYTVRSCIECRLTKNVFDETTTQENTNIADDMIDSSIDISVEPYPTLNITPLFGVTVNSNF